MNFSNKDMGILVSMSIAVICISLVFPALGVSGNETTQNEIPEYNITKDKYDFAGEFPPDPGAPSKGELERIENQSDGDTRSQWLHGDTTNGAEIVVFNNGSLKDPIAEITVTNWTDGTATDTTVELRNVSDRTTMQEAGYKLQVHFAETENLNESNMTMRVEYTILRQPENTDWMSRIPVVGGIMGAGEQLAGIVGWIGSVIYWLFGQMITIFTNMFVVFLDVTFYVIDTFHWLIGTYMGIVEAAPNFSGLFIMIPAIMLFLEFAKIGMITVEVLWIG